MGIQTPAMPGTLVKNFYHGKGKAPQGFRKTSCVKGIPSYSNIFTSEVIPEPILRNLRCDPTVQVFRIERIQ